MRRRDLLPALLLVGLAGFVGGQVLTVTNGGGDGAGPGSAPTRVTDPDPVPSAHDVLASPAARGTYVAASLRPDSLLPRWPHAHDGRAVRVWVQPASPIRGWHPALVADARRAFDVWAAAAPLRFAFTNDSAAADVRVRWSPRLADDRQVGHNRLDYTTDGTIVGAEVTLAVHDDRGEPLPSDVRALTALHEVGHALGLGHSPSAADVMAARHSAAAPATLTAADVATARALYALR